MHEIVEGSSKMEDAQKIGTILIWFVDYILQDQSYSFVESSNPDFGKFQTLPFQSRAAEKKQIFEIFHLQ